MNLTCFVIPSAATKAILLTIRMRGHDDTVVLSGGIIAIRYLFRRLPEPDIPVTDYPGRLSTAAITTLVALFLLASGAGAQDATSLFSEYNDRIYQIRIIENSTGKQAGLGSGFLVSADGLVVTNYHVIAALTEAPDRYSVEFVRINGDTGALALLALDVVNDLALLRREEPPGYYVQLASALPPQGEDIYSIGNPHDLGWTVVPGTYNGITGHSVYERIHFSGSVNPGMSGGPVLNRNGEVIGVNVATAGNQLSFLVPLNRVAEFLDRAPRTPIDFTEVDAAITQQLKDNQRSVVNEMLKHSWGSVEFGNASVPREIAPFIKCWGYVDDDPEIHYGHSATTCNSEDQIYLAHDFSTGNVVYQFNWLESDDLNSFQFYNMLKEKIANTYPDNEGGKNDVTNFQCNDDFVETSAGSGATVVTKTTFCAREYRRFRGVFDVLYFGVSVHERLGALISHFTMAGVEPDLAREFLRKFLDGITWK